MVGQRCWNSAGNRSAIQDTRKIGWMQQRLIVLIIFCILTIGHAFPTPYMPQTSSSNYVAFGGQPMNGDLFTQIATASQYRTIAPPPGVDNRWTMEFLS